MKENIKEQVKDAVKAAVCGSAMFGILGAIAIARLYRMGEICLK